MPKYTRFEDVRIRLAGKVKFTENEEETDLMHVSLAKQLIDEAEGDVEHDLSPRYMAPFQTIDGKAFSALAAFPPTPSIITQLCRMRSVVVILGTDFGRGTSAEGSKYTKQVEARYKQMVEKLLEKAKGSDTGWMYPPLPGLRLNWHNMQADDGYKGAISHTSEFGDENGNYAQEQINQPSQNFVNGELPSVVEHND